MKPLSLEIEQVRHRHPGAALDTPPELSFRLAPGGRALLLGPNGSGKTTLLQRIAGLLDGDGTVRIGGVVLSRRNLPAVRKGLGFLWQNPDDALLLPTTLEDVALGPVNDGMDPKRARAVAADWLARLGVSHLADRPIRRLSMGEKQLVALAGVLAREPGLLLLDEPTAALDDDASERLALALDEIEATTLLVTHEADFWLARKRRWDVVQIAP
ncbi:MAG: energy-coupling factor ABC transporter ATP-binding protein [Myxococcales bacterium]|jgi:cobalt/nickel transport system ATP-binding protein